MPYGDFRQRNGGPIAEREWTVSRRDVTSTAVTSCIILAAPANSGVFAVHLSVFGEGGEPFGQMDAERVLDIMRAQGADRTSVQIFGELDFWGPQLEGYAHLLQNLTIQAEHQASGIVVVPRAALGVGTSCGCCTIM